MMTVLAAGVLLAPASGNDGPSSETEAFESIYYTQLLSGRDPEAALRKAHFYGGYPHQAVRQVEIRSRSRCRKFMIWRAGNLCGGG
jgi:hypothetical protein